VARNVRKRLVTSPKVYVRDSGLVHALLGIGDREALLAPPVAGGTWEGLAIESLFAAAPNGTEAHFFRTAAGGESLEQTIRRYQNRAIEAAQVIEELIGLAKEMREAQARGDELRLSEDELAFYDALETNDSAVKVLADATLRTIPQELVKTVRANVTIDWTVRENVRARRTPSDFRTPASPARFRRPGRAVP
jgi:hypothetical protein